PVGARGVRGGGRAAPPPRRVLRRLPRRRGVRDAGRSRGVAPARGDRDRKDPGERGLEGTPPVAEASGSAAAIRRGRLSSPGRRARGRDAAPLCRPAGGPRRRGLRRRRRMADPLPRPPLPRNPGAIPEYPGLPPRVVEPAIPGSAL